MGRIVKHLALVLNLTLPCGTLIDQLGHNAHVSQARGWIGPDFSGCKRSGQALSDNCQSSAALSSPADLASWAFYPARPCRPAPALWLPWPRVRLPRVALERAAFLADIATRTGGDPSLAVIRRR